MVLAASCAETAPEKGAASVSDEVRAVTFRSGACYGTCPVFECRIDRQGAAVFEGDNFTAVKGERDAPGGRETWDTDTGEQWLSYNTGCADARFRGVKDALAKARALLPVDELVGKGR